MKENTMKRTPRYTLDSFIEEFERTVKKQKLPMILESGRYSRLRSATRPKGSTCLSWCPLEIVVSQFGNRWVHAVEDGFVSSQVRQTIIHAADGLPDHSQTVRARLLKA